MMNCAGLPCAGRFIASRIWKPSMSGRPTSSRTRSNVPVCCSSSARGAVLGFTDDVAVPAQHRGDHAAIERNVFDQHDVERRHRCSSSAGEVVRRFGIEGEGEGGSLSSPCSRGKRSAHSLCDPARQCQPEAKSIGVVAFAPLEGFEQAQQLRVGQPAAGVFHDDRNFDRFLLTAALHVRRSLISTALGIFDRVRQQIAHHLADPSAVDPDDERWRLQIGGNAMSLRLAMAAAICDSDSTSAAISIGFRLSGAPPPRAARSVKSSTTVLRLPNTSRSSLMLTSDGASAARSSRPCMPCSGVRNSWPTSARKRDLARSERWASASLQLGFATCGATTVAPAGFLPLASAGLGKGTPAIPDAFCERVITGSDIVPAETAGRGRRAFRRDPCLQAVTNPMRRFRRRWHKRSGSVPPRPSAATVPLPGSAACAGDLPD